MSSFSEALLDTGASACFMNKNFVLNYSLDLIGKAHPAYVEVIDRRFLALGNMMEKLQPLEVNVENLMSHVVFNIIQCPTNSMVFGLPWFELHNPGIDWNLRKISSKYKKKIKFNL